MTIVKYTISGLVSYLIYLILLVIFVEVFNLEKLISSIFTYGLAMILNFFLLKIWVYKSNKNNKEKFIKYYFIGLIGYFLNSFGFYIFTIKIEYNYLFSQLILFFMIASFNYILNNFWTFKSEKLN
jgi:putative flippase GtrA